MSEEKINLSNVDRIGLGKTNIQVEDLNDKEIEMVLEMGLSFNPATKKWDSSARIERHHLKYFINDDGILTLPLGKIFNLSANNLELKSLHNFPDYVKYSFNINNNELESLKGCPTYIGGDFSCDNNNLKTLEGLGSTLNVLNFSCSNNKLLNLEGCPGVKKELTINNNPLTSLKGMPLVDKESNPNSTLLLNALKTRLKNYAFITTENFNITSLYKISILEEYFVKRNNIRKPKDINNNNTDDLVISSFNYYMSEKDYYLSLADFIIKAERESQAEEIWWHKDVLHNIKNLFTSIKSVNKYNL